MIDAETTALILRLAQVERWPVGTIAGQVGVHHDAVTRVLRDAGLPKAFLTRPARIDRFVPFVLETWAKYPKLRASRLYQMCVERGYVGSPDHFRHAVARLRPRPHGRRRLRHLRHTFACDRLKTWHAEGLPLDRRILDLSTYLGHAKVTDTYWYLSAFPALLAISGDRFGRFAAGKAVRS